MTIISNNNKEGKFVEWREGWSVSDDRLTRGATPKVT